jgi:uncharacterized lipoprotein
MAKSNTRKSAKTVIVTRSNGEDKRRVVQVGKQEAEDAVAEPSQAQLEFAKAKELIQPLAKAGKSEDEMAIVLIQKGDFPFKRAGRLLRKVLEDLGVRMSAKDRLREVSDLLLKADFAPKDWSEVVKICKYLAEEVDATDEKQALNAVKKFAKDQGYELPIKPKGSGGGAKVGFRSVFLTWLEANPTASDDMFDKWIKQHDRKASQVSFYKRILGVMRKTHGG